MTEREIAEIIEQHYAEKWYSPEPSSKAKAAAKDILAVLRERKYAKLIEQMKPTKLHTPAPACRCGAQRVSPTTPHGSWCPLIAPRP